MQKKKKRYAEAGAWEYRGQNQMTVAKEKKKLV